jgi:hypothetical protein
MVFGEVGVVLFYPFGSAMVEQMRRIEGRFAVLSRLQLCGWISITVLGELMFMIWAIAAFRPGSSPEVTRTLNDLGWALMIFVEPQFLLLLFTIAVTVLIDTRAQPVFPRWYGWLTLVIFTANWPGLMMIFFKTGPFDYRGAIALYSPLVSTAVWIVPSTWALLKAIDAHALEIAKDADPGAADQARADQPPSTGITAPVMKSPSPQKQCTIKPATASGSPNSGST